ncbi:MAG: c-type cytochrome [Verrucomicrobiota bacterium]
MIRTTLFSLALTATLPAATRVFQTFEGDGYDGWTTEGNAFGMAPAAGKTDGMKSPFTSYSDESLAASSHGGDDAKGTLTSQPFTISEDYITFLIAGGDFVGKTSAQLVIDGEVVQEATGKRSLRCIPVVWDVAALKGREARIRLIDDTDGTWGFIGVDHLLFTDYPNQKFPGPTREGKPYIDGLSGAETLPEASIPDGSTLKIEATHADQQVTSPTALTFDDFGNVYISETHRFREGIEDDRDHLYWYLDDLAAKTTADRRALHEKWKGKVSLEHMTAKSEVIRRLADTNGDGKLDSNIFADGFNDVLDGTAAGVFHYGGSLYFACIPKIYQLRDKDGDGKADEKKVVADGFGVRVSLSGHDLNGFTLGPDGRIYGTVGDRGMSLITTEGKSIDYPNEGAVFRFEPDGTGFELFHTGLRNPKEIAFDAYGNPFTVDNNSDQGDSARIVYLVEGGDSGWQMEHQTMHSFHRQIGLAEHPPSRWMDERMWEMQNPAQPAYILPPSALLTSGPSGLTYHPGVGFLESEANHFLICDYRGGSANSGIWSFEMSPNGAGMEMTDSRQFLWGVAATDVEYSWDGKVFVTDFMGGWESHANGRLLSLDAGKKLWQPEETEGAARMMREGLEKRDSAALLTLLRHPDARIRLRAQLALTRKTDGIDRLVEATNSSDPLARIHGIWGLGILARRGPAPLPVMEFGAMATPAIRNASDAKLASLLDDKDPEIRVQALRALADSAAPLSNISLGPLFGDASPRVRYFAAIVAGKRGLISMYGPICEMIAKNDNRDPYLRHAGIFALQHLATKPTLLTALNTHESAAVRLAAVVALRRMKNPGISRFLADEDTQVADEAIRAIVDLDWVAQRPAVARLMDDLASRKWTPFMLRRLIHNAFRIGTAENAARVAKVAANPEIPEIVRQEAFRLLSEWATPFPADQLTGHWRPLEKRDPATVRTALLETLPDVLKQRGFAVTAALGLVAKYDLQVPGLDDKALREMIRDAAQPPAARSAALDLVIRQKPADLDPFLTDLATDPSDEVAVTALATIVKLTPSTALSLLEKSITSSSPSRARKAWPILASLPGPEADAFLIAQLDALRAAKGVSPTALELIDAARQRKSPTVKAAFTALEKSLADNSDPLAKWNATLEGGDPVAGQAIFASHPASECMRCHRAEGGHSAGGETAPNLAGIAKRHSDPRYFLESMIAPSAVITPGFGSVLIDFHNGADLTGNLIAETPDHVDLDASGKLFRISRQDIKGITTATSPMPAMGELLKPKEMRDVIAWLGSLTEGGEEPAPTAEPIALDPATLITTATSEKPSSIDPAVMKAGRVQYLLCGACHGQNGEGTAAGPPLAGSEWVTGPEENLIRIQLRGLTGPIKVKGQEYNVPGGMAALAYQNDDQIAAALTYIRNSFGNSAPPVSAAAVAALRGEVGKPQLTATDLTPPNATEKPATPSEPNTPSGKYDDLQRESGIAKWALLGSALLAAVALIAFLRRKQG